MRKPPIVRIPIEPVERVVLDPLFTAAERDLLRVILDQVTIPGKVAGLVASMQAKLDRLAAP